MRKANDVLIRDESIYFHKLSTIENYVHSGPNLDCMKGDVIWFCPVVAKIIYINFLS